jgi:hypothetical protein
MAKLTAELVIRTGVVRYSDLGFIAASNRVLDSDESGNGIILTWDSGAWGATDPFSWAPTSSCFSVEPKRNFVVIGGDDNFAICGGGDFITGNILAQLKPSKDGLVRSVKDINGWAYAVGYGGLVVKRNGLAEWTRVDAGMGNGARLEAIHGFSEQEMYAVGVDGAIWMFERDSWRSIPSPTNVILSCVCCAGDGAVYAGGQDGLLLRGVKDQWVVMEQDVTRAHIWDLEWFRGRLYASTYSAIYELTANGLAPVDLKSKQPNTTYHLSSCDDALWSVGELDIVSFDGKKWSPISTSI